MNPPEIQYPVAELAKSWRVSKGYIYQLIASGELEAVQLPAGRAKTRVSESAAKRFIAKNTRRAAA